MAHAVHELGFRLALGVGGLQCLLKTVFFRLFPLMERRGVLDQHDAAHDGKLILDVAAVLRILRHEHDLLRPLRLAVRSCFAEFDGHLVRAAFETRKQLLRGICEPIAFQRALGDGSDMFAAKGRIGAR